MKTFTVVGVYESDGQVFADLQKAPDAYAAMQLSARESTAGSDLCILGAYEGEAAFVTPGDDNGKSAYASDLATGED